MVLNLKISKHHKFVFFKHFEHEAHPSCISLWQVHMALIVHTIYAQFYQNPCLSQRAKALRLIHIAVAKCAILTRIRQRHSDSIKYQSRSVRSLQGYAKGTRTQSSISREVCDPYKDTPKALGLNQVSVAKCAILTRIRQRHSDSIKYQSRSVRSLQGYAKGTRTQSVSVAKCAILTRIRQRHSDSIKYQSRSVRSLQGYAKGTRTQSVSVAKCAILTRIRQRHSDSINCQSRSVRSLQGYAKGTRTQSSISREVCDPYKDTPKALGLNQYQSRSVRSLQGYAKGTRTQSIVSRAVCDPYKVTPKALGLSQLSVAQCAILTRLRQRHSDSVNCQSRSVRSLQGYAKGTRTQSIVSRAVCDPYKDTPGTRTQSNTILITF
ncbi:uncharacterized protein LOC105662080 [Megachile rotundata]|uniref:uncharacterized protein LOC105662080 n=1 Tax=Megachile rotundata TaxID=143995 RepID=UPI003FD111C1